MSAQQQVVTEAVDLVRRFNEVILFPFIALLSAIAFLVFLYGCAEYIFNGSNEAARTKGVAHITYGLIGLVVMVTAWSIMLLATATFGLDDELNCAKDPTQSGCANIFNVGPK